MCSSDLGTERGIERERERERTLCDDQHLVDIIVQLFAMRECGAGFNVWGFDVCCDLMLCVYVCECV